MTIKTKNSPYSAQASDMKRTEAVLDAYADLATVTPKNSALADHLFSLVGAQIDSAEQPEPGAKTPVIIGGVALMFTEGLGRPDHKNDDGKVGSRYGILTDKETKNTISLTDSPLAIDAITVSSPDEPFGMPIDAAREHRIAPELVTLLDTLAVSDSPTAA